LQPILTHLANTAGLPSSPYFDASGDYTLKLEQGDSDAVIGSLGAVGDYRPHAEALDRMGVPADADGA
jgi:hypothetical protein